MKTAFILFAHGSSVESANDAVRSVARDFAREGGYALVEASFLEAAEPDLPAAVRRMIQKGAEEIIVIPYFLTLGIHLQRDLPRIVEGLNELYHGVTLSITDPLDGHHALTQILLDRAQKAMECKNTKSHAGQD